MPRTSSIRILRASLRAIYFFLPWQRYFSVLLRKLFRIFRNVCYYVRLTVFARRPTCADTKKLSIMDLGGASQVLKFVVSRDYRNTCEKKSGNSNTFVSGVT